MSSVLDVSDLHVNFQTYSGVVQAVRGVSFSLRRGEALAIVGESGSGKSVTARAIMGLLPKNAEVSGAIKYNPALYEGTKPPYHSTISSTSSTASEPAKSIELIGLPDRQMRKIRGNDISMVFQDPMTCLDPTMTIGAQVAEPLRIHGVSRSLAKRAACDILAAVGIPDPARRMKQYPHQFSGGQRQRIAIATALISKPQVLIADEPTTALDVRIQAQILDLLREYRAKTEISTILVTHDLGVVASFADRVAVMYAGRIVEIGTVRELFYYPQHPYTWGLLGSLPNAIEVPGSSISVNAASNSKINQIARLTAIPGAPPSLLNPPPGDAFAARNQFAIPKDYQQAPPLFKLSDTHYAATWLLADNAPKVTPPPHIQKRWEYWKQ